MEHRNVWFPGVPFALGAAVLFGASTPFSKLLLGSIGPWFLAGILYLGAGLSIGIETGPPIGVQKEPPV